MILRIWLIIVYCILYMPLYIVQNMYVDDGVESNDNDV